MLLNGVEDEQPSARLKENFGAFLAEEIQKEETTVIPLQQEADVKTYLRIAASIVLILGAFFLGKYSNSTPAIVPNTEQLAVLDLLQDPSASKRILAVSKLETASVENTRIINALINKLFLDNNVNVRMAACEALERFTSLKEVRNAFIKALETEKEPAIQIELIHILADIQEKRALVPMKKLLEDEATPNYVKQELTYNISSLI